MSPIRSTHRQIGDVESSELAELIHEAFGRLAPMFGARFPEPGAAFSELKANERALLEAVAGEIRDFFLKVGRGSLW